MSKTTPWTEKDDSESELVKGLVENKEAEEIKNRVIEQELELERERVRRLAERKRIHFVEKESRVGSGIVKITYYIYKYGGEAFISNEDLKNCITLGGFFECEIASSSSQFSEGENIRINSDYFFESKEEAEKYIKENNVIDIYEVRIYNGSAKKGIPICNIDTPEPIHIATIIKACNELRDNYTFVVTPKLKMSKIDFYSQPFISSVMREGDKIPQGNDFEICQNGMSFEVSAHSNRQKQDILDKIKWVINFYDEDDERVIGKVLSTMKAD